VADVIPFPVERTRPPQGVPVALPAGATLIGYTEANAAGPGIPIFEGPAPPDAYVWCQGDSGE
jgi:hypothetical protein